MEENTKKPVTFTPEQLQEINRLVGEMAKASNTRSSAPISMYNLRDPKNIETVNVRQDPMDGAFVVGYKDMQGNPFEKAKGNKRYVTYELDPITKKTEPFLTLILSKDGVEFTEKKVRLDDFTNNFKKMRDLKCLKVDVKEIIEDWGMLGSTGEYAGPVDASGKPSVIPNIMAQTKREERTYLIEIPGFKEPYLITDSQFLA